MWPEEIIFGYPKIFKIIGDSVDLLLACHLVIISQRNNKLLTMGQVPVLLGYTDAKFQEIVFTRVGS